uniref:DUF2190 family protein n=1 Tax=uncultured Sphingomonas sp. TaxID=158754 RepID=UPI0035CC6D45
MKNYIQMGVNDSDMIAPYALTSGQGFLDGTEFGVASNDTAIGAQVVGVTAGIFDLPKAAVAIARKTKAYWDNAARLVTNVSAGNTQIGVFQTAALAGDATARVKLRWVA